MRDASQYGKQHQGWVELESTVGQGTTFRVHFCVSDAPVDIALEPAILLADRHGPAPAGEDEVNSAYPIKECRSYLRVAPPLRLTIEPSDRGVGTRYTVNPVGPCESLDLARRLGWTAERRTVDRV